MSNAITTTPNYNANKIWDLVSIELQPQTILECLNIQTLRTTLEKLRMNYMKQYRAHLYNINMPGEFTNLVIQRGNTLLDVLEHKLQYIFNDDKEFIHFYKEIADMIITNMQVMEDIEICEWGPYIDNIQCRLDDWVV